MTKKIKALAIFAMAAGLCGWFQGTAAAFTNVTNAFASDASNPNAGATSVSATSVIGSSNSQTATIGPNFVTTVTVPAASGLAYTEKVEINNLSSNPGQMTINDAGLGSGSGTFTTTKVFTGNTLSDFTTYQFTLSRAAGSSVSVLNSLQFNIAIGAQSQLAVTTVPADLATATSAVYTFTTGNVDNVTAFSLTISGGNQPGTFILTGASLVAVPEGSTTGLGLLGGMGLMMLRRSRFMRG